MATWFTENRSGSASISDKIYLQLETAQQASHIYIAADNPLAARKIDQYTSGECNFIITARVASAVMHADARLCFAITDGEVSSGSIAFLDNTGAFGLGGWNDSGDAGTEAGACPLNGLGWIRLVCRGGVVSAGCGTGTTSQPPTNWYTIQTGSPRGSRPFEFFAVHLTKWSTGGPAVCSVDNVKIESFKDF